VSVPNDPGGTSAPGTATNGMLGPLISFCALCGREFEPQNTRRGQPKLFGRKRRNPYDVKLWHTMGRKLTPLGSCVGGERFSEVTVSDIPLD
jgi:hypothetical protein